MVNLNEVAKQITLQEGKKESLSIAQVKEVMHLVIEWFFDLSDEDKEEVMEKIKASKS